MTRTTKPDPDDANTTDPAEASAPEPQHTAAVEPGSDPTPEPAPAPDPDDLYEPFPGPEFFHGGRNSPIVQAAGRRLAQEGHWKSAQTPGPDWTSAHRRAFASFQQELRPKGGGDTSGTPDRVAWEKLNVPRVSPR